MKGTCALCTGVPVGSTELLVVTGHYRRYLELFFGALLVAAGLRSTYAASQNWGGDRDEPRVDWWHAWGWELGVMSTKGAFESRPTPKRHPGNQLGIANRQLPQAARLGSNCRLSSMICLFFVYLHEAHGSLYLSAMPASGWNQGGLKGRCLSLLHQCSGISRCATSELLIGSSTTLYRQG